MPRTLRAGWAGAALRLAAAALGTPDLRRLELAWAFAAVGGWAFMVALAIHAYAVGGAAAVGLAALVRMVPAGLAAPLMGLAGDRMSRRDVLLVTCLARAAALAGAALAVVTDAPFAALLALAAVFTVLQAAHRPAQSALLPHLAPGAQRQAAANALCSGIDSASFIAGALAAGLLAAAAGAAVAFAASAVAFAAAGPLLARIPRDTPATGDPLALEPGFTGRSVPKRRRHGAALGRLSVDMRHGLETVAGDARLRLLVGTLSVSTLVEGMVDVLVVVTALRLVDLGDAGVGLLNAAWGVGGLLGGVAALAFIGHGRIGSALPAGGMLIGLPLVALAWFPVPALALALLLVLGTGYALVEVSGQTLLQRLAADSVRARAFGVVESSYWLTTGAGAMLAPLVVALAGPRGALAVVGAGLPLLMLARWAALTRLADAAPARLVPEREPALAAV